MVHAAVPLKPSDSSIERHDLNHFEVKLDFPLQPAQPQNLYNMDVYFFLPRSLQINENTYSNQQFYSDLRFDLRFKTPQMAISGIVNPSNELSPFVKLDRDVQRILNGDPSPEIRQEIKDQFRLLGCMIKTNLRDQIDYFLTQPHLFTNQEEQKIGLRDYLSDLTQLQQKMAHLSVDFSRIQIPELRETYIFLDKYISLQIEEYITSAVYQLSQRPDYADLRPEMIHLIEYEQSHREILKSRLIARPDSDNEEFIFWEGIFKKYVQGVLYLGIRSKDEQSRVLKPLYSLAAGIAMMASVLLGFLIVNKLSGETFAYVLIVALIYMIKDWINDNLKGLSHKIVHILYPDRKFNIYDGGFAKKFGTSKEIMRFIPWKALPSVIYNIRESSAKSILEREGKPEIVFRYHQQIILYTKAILEQYERFGDINEILRINIANFLHYADDPIHIEKVWDPSAQQVNDIECSKVYHLNLIFQLTSIDRHSKEQRSQFKKVRVIMDQRGIKRIEEIPFTL